MISQPSAQLVMFRLGLVLATKYPDKFAKLSEAPLSEVAEFLNEHEGTNLQKGTDMETVEKIQQALLEGMNDDKLGHAEENS